MSEHRRRLARDHAFDARNGLAALIKHSGVTPAYAEKMQVKLVELWTEAVSAMGDLGEPVYPSLMTQVKKDPENRK